MPNTEDTETLSYVGSSGIRLLKQHLIRNHKLCTSHVMPLDLALSLNEMMRNCLDLIKLIELQHKCIQQQAHISGSIFREKNNRTYDLKDAIKYVKSCLEAQKNGKPLPPPPKDLNDLMERVGNYDFEWKVPSDEELSQIGKELPIGIEED